MTIELLHVIRDYNIHLQGHQYQNMQDQGCYGLMVYKNAMFSPGSNILIKDLPSVLIQ